MSLTVEALAQEIRRADENYGAGNQLATALLPFIERHIAAGQSKPAGNAIDGLLATARPFLAEELLLKQGYTWSGSGWVAPAPKPAGDPLPDPHNCRACTHPDCGRYDGPREVECRAMKDSACAREYKFDSKPAGAVPLPECDVDVVTLAGVRVLAYTPDGLREYGDAREAAARSAGRADAVPGGWSGWATQYPDKLPKLFGALEIAELNHYPEEGARLIYLIEATPLPRQPAAEDNLQWALDQGGILADWCNQAGNALKALMAAYERKIRTDCALADLESKPWRCAEYVQAEEAMRAKPAPTVNFEPAAVNQQIKVVGYRWRNSDHHPWTLGEAVSGFDLNSREIGAVIEPLGVINQQMTTQGERDIELADAEALERAANLTCSSLRGTVNEPGLTIWKFNRSALANFVREITGGQADA